MSLSALRARQEIFEEYEGTTTPALYGRWRGGSFNSRLDRELSDDVASFSSNERELRMASPPSFQLESWSCGAVAQADLTSRKL
jgi:hypothetical protein